MYRENRNTRPVWLWDIRSVRKHTQFFFSSDFENQNLPFNTLIPWHYLVQLHRIAELPNELYPIFHSSTFWVHCTAYRYAPNRFSTLRSKRLTSHQTSHQPDRVSMQRQTLACRDRDLSKSRLLTLPSFPWLLRLLRLLRPRPPAFPCVLSPMRAPCRWPYPSRSAAWPDTVPDRG